MTTIDDDDDDDLFEGQTELTTIEIENPTVYFAHSYTLWKTSEELDWLKLLAKRFPHHEIINPFDEEDELCKKYGGLPYYQKYELYGFNTNLIEHAREIRVKDLQTVEQSEIIVAYVENKRQIGTCIEIEHAWEHSKIVYVICEQPSPFFIGNPDIFWYPNKYEFFKGVE
jgi:hypothetical protein